MNISKSLTDILLWVNWGSNFWYWSLQFICHKTVHLNTRVDLFCSSIRMVKPDDPFRQLSLHTCVCHLIGDLSKLKGWVNKNYWSCLCCTHFHPQLCIFSSDSGRCSGNGRYSGNGRGSFSDRSLSNGGGCCRRRGCYSCSCMIAVYSGNSGSNKSTGIGSGIDR